jgi:hypothetical protein
MFAEGIPNLKGEKMSRNSFAVDSLTLPGIIGIKRRKKNLTLKTNQHECYTFQPHFNYTASLE